MKRTASLLRSAASGLVVMAVTGVLAPATSYAQLPSGSEKGAYAGASVGVYAETAEGRQGQAVAGSAIIGYRFNARWAIEGEFGRTGSLYCYEAFVSADQQARATYCHRDPIFNIGAVRRFTAGSLRPYVVFGFGAGVHVGAGVEVPFGRRFAISTGVDVNVLPDMLAARPKVALLVRF